MANLRGLYKIIVKFDNIESNDRYFCIGGYSRFYLSTNHGEAYRCSKEDAENLKPLIKRDWPAVTDVQVQSS